MAKIRVYELARDLNMTNRILLDKIKKMDLNVEVRSHMSSLDDEAVLQIKANVQGKTPEQLIEKRVKSTIIRRRKRQDKPPAPPIEANTESPTPESPSNDTPPSLLKESQTNGPEVPPTSDLGEAHDRSEESDKVSSRLTDQEQVSKSEDIADQNDSAIDTSANKENGSASATPSEPTPPITKKKGPDFEPAKVIQRPEPPKAEEPKSSLPQEEEKVAEPFPSAPPVPEASEQPSLETPAAQTQAPDTQKPQADTTVSADEAVQSPSAESIDITKQQDQDTPSSLSSEASATEPESQTPTAPETDETREQKTARPKKKKAKKQVAAKIIKLPDIMPEEASDSSASPMESNPQRSDGNDEGKPINEGGDDQGKSGKFAKGKKKGVFVPEEDSEKRFFKKKISFRKKAVIEGNALYEGGRGKKGRKGAKLKTAVGQKTQITTPKAIKRRIKIDDTIALSDLAKRMGIKANEMIQKLMTLGVMATVNQTIDFDTAVLVAAEFDYEVEKASFEENLFLQQETDAPEKMTERPPVVTIMGHVDHGKTSLLDVIRKSKIADDEAGGITQHIGAYNVKTPNGNIVFLDTPGHEAFTSMRSRGAQVTDIVILVVAADDGVMPQTVEAINHSKAANVPVIVAVNKMDKKDADPDRVKRELSEHDVVAEDWGGDTIFVNVSAKTKQGIDDLLDMVLLQSEVLELKANPDKLARGYVIEAKLDSGRGPVATILIQDGTLKAGQAIVCGIHHGKVRAMINDKRQNVKEAAPSIPVEVIGLTGVPIAGDELLAISDEKNAKQVSSHRVQKQRAKELAKSSRLSLEGLFEKMEEGKVQDLNLIIKADVHGSIEALKDSLSKLSTKEVKINVVHAATGTVTESDISLAAVSNAIIIGFNVRPGSKVHEMANEEKVDMRFYNIIYNVIKDIKDAMIGMMQSTFEERLLGRAEVREVFVIPKKGTIAGSYVLEGKVERNRNVRLIRDGIVIVEGKLSSLKRFKDDAKEVLSGYECGIGIENYNDIKMGDVIDCYYLEEIKPTI